MDFQQESRNSIEDNKTDLPPIEYFSERVMRHIDADMRETFAIHDVYFNHNDDFVTCTVDALSPREPSVASLRSKLEEIMPQDENSAVHCGDAGYQYARETILGWLEALELPVIEYGSDNTSQADGSA